MAAPLPDRLPEGFSLQTGPIEHELAGDIHVIHVDVHIPENYEDSQRALIEKIHFGEMGLEIVKALPPGLREHPDEALAIFECALRRPEELVGQNEANRLKFAQNRQNMARIIAEHIGKKAANKILGDLEQDVIQMHTMELETEIPPIAPPMKSIPQARETTDNLHQDTKDDNHTPPDDGQRGAGVLAQEWNFVPGEGWDQDTSQISVAQGSYTQLGKVLNQDSLLEITPEIQDDPDYMLAKATRKVGFKNTARHYLSLLIGNYLHYEDDEIGTTAEEIMSQLREAGRLLSSGQPIPEHLSQLVAVKRLNQLHSDNSPAFSQVMLRLSGGF